VKAVSRAGAIRQLANPRSSRRLTRGTTSGSQATPQGSRAPVASCPEERPNPLLDGCKCAACTALRAALTADGQVDTKLVRFYGTKLLQRYWSGRTEPAEKAYQQAHASWAAAARAAGQRAAARNPVAMPRPEVQPISLLQDPAEPAEPAA
jgi:hypothetical protein